MTAAIRFEPASATDSLRETFARNGARIAAVDGACIMDKHSLLTALGHALEFARYYGVNWDAAEECLRDLQQRHPRGVALFVDHAGALWQRLPREMGTLVSIWLSASDELSKGNIPLQLVFLLDESPSPPERAG